MWVGVYFQLLYSALTTNFGRLFVMKARTHHFTANVLIWALVRVPQFVIYSYLVSCRLSICILSYISIWLRHSSHVWDTADIAWVNSLIATGKVVSMVLRSYHSWGSILISNSDLSSLSLLIFDEFIMSPGTVIGIGIISLMSIWHLLRQLLVADCNHGSLTITHLPFMLLNCLSVWAYKYYVALINSSIVWATVRSLLVASPQAGSTSIIQTSNRVSTHVLVRWAEVE